jgi:probable HAF family extracellular repeat protein
MSVLDHHLARLTFSAWLERLRRAPGPLIITGFVALLVAGCRDSVSPIDRIAPAPATPLLVGATTIDLLADQDPSVYVRADVRGINDAGQVTGSRFVITVNDWRPYRWTPGTGFVALTGLCCGVAWGADINNSGVVVGQTQGSANEGNHAFVAESNTMVDLGLLSNTDPELASSNAVAINDPGEIVGWADANVSGSYPYERHAVLWKASSHDIQDLGTLGAGTSEAVDINASSQVIGMSDVSGGSRHGFLWTTGGGMQDLSTLLGTPASDVAAINDAGQIAGSFVTGAQTHAFLYTPGTGLRDLGTLGGDASAATGLNAQGDVVGSSRTAAGETHAFLWTASDGMEDITAVSGITDVRKLNDDLQTLSGALATSPTAHAYLVNLTVASAWPFSGFANPIAPAPEFNTITAGREVILHFGLGGDRGLGIFAAGSPSTVEVSCATGTPTGNPTPLSSTDVVLRYQADADRYMLRWDTSRAWAGTCRQLTLALIDGSTHVALFSFR